MHKKEKYKALNKNLRKRNKHYQIYKYKRKNYNKFKKVKSNSIKYYYINKQELMMKYRVKKD